MNLAKRFVSSTVRIAIGVVVGMLIIWTTYVIYQNNFSQEAQDKYVHEIYQKIIISSGLSQYAVPLEIVEKNVYNAGTDGERMYVYRGLIDRSSWDSIALVLGHEYAHITLGHTRMKQHTIDDVETQISESLADKLGAVYMIKAGFDVCAAREAWKTMRLEEGNYLGDDHPNYSYRFDELNINCE